MASVQKRGKESWLLVVSVGYDAKGKRAKKTKTIKARTKKEAEKELAKFVVEVEAGEYIAPNKMRLSDFVEEWENKYAKKHLGINCRKKYRIMINNHVLPVLGNKRIDQIQPIHIVNLLDQATRKDGRSGELSPNSLLTIHIALNHIFKRAKEWKVIKENPVNSIARPRLKKKKKILYEKEDLAALLDALQHEPYEWKVYYLMSMLTGVRTGELNALTWNRVNFENKTIDISHSLIYDNGPIIKETKTESSERFVPLATEFVPILEEYHLWQKKIKIKLDGHWVENSNFVFCNLDTGHPYYPKTPSKRFHKLIQNHKLKPLTLHGLRKLCGTYLSLKGVPLTVIKDYLGHSNIKTTAEIYIQPTNSAKHEAAECFNELIPSYMKKSPSH